MRLFRSFQSRVSKLESHVRLLEDALINNEIKIKTTDQYSGQNNIHKQYPLYPPVC